MKVLILCLVVVAATAAEELHWSDEIAARTGGIPISFGASRRVNDNDDPTTPSPQPNTCDSLYSCHDCNTARICRPQGNNGVFVELQTIPCPKERPYCSRESGTCVEEEPLNCGQKDDFICMKDGLFPDTDCSKYHACSHFESVTFQCADNSKYNPVTKKCEFDYQCTDGTFTCDSGAKKVFYPSAAKYFAYCNADATANGSPLVIDSCPGPYKLNVTSQTCEAHCEANGIIPDMEDCHFYYKCTLTVISKALSYYNKERIQCPTGEAYSVENYICQDEKTVQCDKADEYF